MVTTGNLLSMVNQPPMVYRFSLQYLAHKIMTIKAMVSPFAVSPSYFSPCRRLCCAGSATVSGNVAQAAAEHEAALARKDGPSERCFPGAVAGRRNEYFRY